MKILQVTPRYPPQSGGVETHVEALSERLVEMGHEIEVVTADAGESGQRWETRDGVRVRRHRSVAPSGAIHLCPAIATAVRQSNADVVHAHNYHSTPWLVAAFAADGPEFVVTPHYHGASASRLRDALLSIYRVPGGTALRLAGSVVAVSEWERSTLHSEFGVDPTVIPNGLDLSRFENAEPEVRDRPYLLCIGRLRKYKGVQHAIRALPALDGYDLVVAGEGPFRDDLEGIASEMGVADRVDFLGFVDGDRLPGLYAGAAVHLALSEFEAYGMTVAESLAAGTPAVVRESAALAEWARRDGCLGLATVEPSSVATAVERAAALEPSTEGLLTWDEVAERIEREYGALLAGGPEATV